MTKDEAKQLWAKSQANGNALDKCCGPHEFVDITPEKKIGKQYRCERCGGTVDGIAHYWYLRGMEHAR